MYHNWCNSQLYFPDFINAFLIQIHIFTWFRSIAPNSIVLPLFETLHHHTILPKYLLLVQCLNLFVNSVVVGRSNRIHVSWHVPISNQWNICCFLSHQKLFAMHQHELYAQVMCNALSYLHIIRRCVHNISHGLTLCHRYTKNHKTQYRIFCEWVETKRYRKLQLT